MAISINKSSRDEIITVLAIVSVFMLIAGLNIIQKPTMKQMQVSVNQGQRQADANNFQGR